MVDGGGGGEVRYGGAGEIRKAGGGGGAIFAGDRLEATSLELRHCEESGLGREEVRKKIGRASCRERVYVLV